MFDGARGHGRDRFVWRENKEHFQLDRAFYVHICRRHPLRRRHASLFHTMQNYHPTLGYQ